MRTAEGTAAISVRRCGAYLGRRRADDQGALRGRGDRQPGPPTTPRDAPERATDRYSNGHAHPPRPRRSLGAIASESATPAPDNLARTSGTRSTRWYHYGGGISGQRRGLPHGRTGKKKVLAEDGRASPPRRCTVSAPRALRMLQPTPPGARYCGSGGW